MFPPTPDIARLCRKVARIDTHPGKDVTIVTFIFDARRLRARDKASPAETFEPFLKALGMRSRHHMPFLAATRGLRMRKDGKQEYVVEVEIPTGDTALLSQPIRYCERLIADRHPKIH